MLARTTSPGEPQVSLTDKVNSAAKMRTHRDGRPDSPNSIPLGIWLILPAFVLFLIGVLVPSVAVNEFGNLRRLSLLAGIRDLWETGHAFLAVVIFLFTILFPPAKLAAILAIGMPSLRLSGQAKRRLRALVANLGKWSLLDVAVIAILIVAIKVKGFVSVEAAWGIYAFTLSIVLSMLATHFLKGGISNVPVLGAKSNPTRVARNGRSMALIAVGLVLTFCGTGWFFLAPIGTIDQVHVTRKETFIELPRLFGNPSLYIQVRTLEGVHRLDTKPRTPIGNGLMWTLEQPVPLANVYEVEIFEDGLFSDKLVDRVTINSRWPIGQRFQFELKGRRDWQRPAALATVIFGIGFLLIAKSSSSKRPRGFPQLETQENA